MKKLLCVLLCCVMAMCMISCNKQEEGSPDGMKKASADGIGYSVYVPSDWVVKSSTESLLVEARVSDEDSSNVTVMRYYNSSIEIDASKENFAETAIRDYWADYKDQLEKVFDVDDEKKTTMKLADENGYKCVMGSGWEGSGVTAVEYDYTATLGGVELSYAQIIAFYDNYFYIVTFTTRPDLFDMHAEYVADIVKYIKVR